MSASVTALALLRVVLCVVVISKHASAEAEPQLNLPPFGQVGPTGRPQVLPNSYSGPTSAGQQNGDPRKEGDNFDQSRSQRFGPPYDDGDDEEENYPQGRSNDDRQDRQNKVSLTRSIATNGPQHIQF